MTETSEIWTGEAISYDRTRPTPPPALLDLLTQLIHMSHPALVVDVGSGTDFQPRFGVSGHKMNHYFLHLLEGRRQDPCDDLITSLSKAEIDGERLSRQELVNFCFLLLAAGQETTNFESKNSSKRAPPGC